MNVPTWLLVSTGVVGIAASLFAVVVIASSLVSLRARVKSQSPPAEAAEVVTEETSVVDAQDLEVPLIDIRDMELPPSDIDDNALTWGGGWSRPAPSLRPHGVALLDVKAYRPDADEIAVEGLLKTYALVMTGADSRYVALSDAEERATVKANFLRKKLGLELSDADAEAALDEVAETMKADRTKSRITVYYLLAEKFGKLELFH